MAVVGLSPLFNGYQVFDNNGNMAAGALLYTQVAGSTQGTPQPTYTTITGSVQNANPIVADSTGRFNTEIWLDSTLSYQFVLKTAAGSTIGTWNNINAVGTGIVENVATNLFTATAGQTVINLATVGESYTPNTNSIAVYRNGLRLITGEDFTESSSTTITLTTAAVAGDQFLISSSANINPQTIPSSTVTYSQGNINAITRTVTSKLQESVSVKDFGAVGDGVHDDTAAIQAAINAVASNSSVSGGKQVGGVVWIPKGRYRVTSTITGLTDGITIRGEPSGLDGVPLTLPSSGSQIYCDSTVPSFPMFTVSDGGPITIQDIGLNGTQTVTNSICIQSGTGTTNVGATQAHFSNVRFTGFTSVVNAAKFIDVSFYDCGFEYNTTCFNFIGGTYTALGYIKFVSCIFFGGSSAYFNLSAGANLNNITFASCIFQYDSAQTVNCNIFDVYDATLLDASFASCNFVGYSGDNCLRSLSDTSAIQNITFSSCNFQTTNPVDFSYIAPLTSTIFNIIFSGCVFNQGTITSAYELQHLIVSSCIFLGAAQVVLSSCNYLTVIGNDFSAATANPPIALTDIFNRVTISNNIFADTVTSIPINAASTKVNISNNINASSLVSTVWTGVTAGSGGWVNGTPTPQFYVDNNGFVNMRGIVTNASPAANSIMCTLPAANKPSVIQTFVIPETSAGGYIIATVSTDGNIYCIARTGTGSKYDLSVVRFTNT